jgi:putative ABC transport system substrate-binding protein
MIRREFIAGLGATGWPLLVRAQQQTKPVIGWLHVRPGGLLPETIEGIRRGLAEFGFSEGRDVTVEYLTADGHIERLPALAADLVRRRPAAIVAATGIAALAAKAATRDIPIIFTTAGDPVELGLVASFNRPGGNLTGVTTPFSEIAEKRLGLLNQAVPAAETIALLVGPELIEQQLAHLSDEPHVPVETKHVQSAARTLGLRLLVFNITTDAEVALASATLTEQRAGAILVSASPIVDAKRDQILSHAARFAIPTMFAYSHDARAGGLLSYGPDLNELFRQMGAYTGRILKGEKPGDLPVQFPTKFELVVNLKTAKALGLTIPPNLLAIADEVIE